MNKSRIAIVGLMNNQSQQVSEACSGTARFPASAPHSGPPGSTEERE